MVDQIGAIAYIPFKSNHTGERGGPGSAYEQALHFFKPHRDEFEARYHQRSNAETVMSMIETSCGDAVRMGTDTSRHNEVLSKVIAHDIRCLIKAGYDLGADPSFSARNAA